MSVEQYLNIRGIDPRVWGNSGWKFLNSIALVYNEKKKENYKKFFMSLPYVLPCDDCGENLKNEIKNLDEALKNNKSLLKWLLKIRNNISVDNGKEKITMKDAILEIFNQNNSQFYQYVWIFIMVLILVLLIFILKYYSENKDISKKKNNI
jgi:hypothetical protein